jgi:Tfp pilus assembly protein PilN
MTLNVSAMKSQLARSALGMEFGDGILTVACLRETLSGAYLATSGSYPFHPERHEDLVSEIKRYLSQNGLHRKSVSVAIPAKWSLIKFLDIPAPGRGSLKGIMQYEVERHIPFRLQEVYYDYQVLRNHSAQCRVALAAVPKENVAAILEFLRKIPLEPRAIHVASFCRMNAVGCSGNGGGGWGNLARFAGIPRLISAGDVVAVSLYVGPCEAEMGILIGDACVDLIHLISDPSRTEPFLQELSSELGKRLFALSIKKIDRLLIWGPGSDDRGLRAAVEDKLHAKAIPLNPISRISRDARDGQQQGISASVGACLSELGLGWMTINLLPHGRRARLRRVGPLIAKVAMAAILLLGLGLLASGAFYEQRVLWMIEEQLKTNEPEVAAIEKLAREKSEHDRDLKILQGLKTPSVKMLDLLAELAQVMPPAAWITSLDYLEQDKKNALSKGDLTVSGLAVSSSRLISLLEDSPSFEQVEFVGPITKREGREGFKIRAVVVKPGQGQLSMEKTNRP